MTRRQRRRALWLTGLAIVGIAAVLVIVAWPYGSEPDAGKADEPGDDGPVPLAPGAPGGMEEDRAYGAPENGTDEGDGGEEDATTKPAPDPAPKIPDDPEPLPAAKALVAFEEGMELAGEDKLVEARGKLSEAVFSERLPADMADAAREKLWELAQATIFARHAYPGDPYTFMHEFEKGDRLADKRTADGKVVPGLVTELELRVPAAAILRANGVRAEDLKYDMSYKLIRGPFHAKVYKGEFVMDVFLQREDEDLPRVFIRRLPVGLGKDGSTPVGSWVVHSKMLKAPWYPPGGDPDLPAVVYFEDKANYPFGPKGRFVGLEGIDKITRQYKTDMYGLHGTTEPETIGTEGSRGCIRLDDEGVRFVYDVLFEGHSTVYIRP